MKRRLLPLVFLAVLGQGTLLGQPLTPEGNSSADRLAFISKLDDESSPVPRSVRDRYLLGALADPSADVRRLAAYRLRGNAFVASLIRILSTDPDLYVRQSAAISLSHWITDNGQETCTAVEEATGHLDQLLRGLEDDATAQHVIEVLGGRPSGGKPLACCMPEEAKARVRVALTELVQKPPRHTIASYWSSTIPGEALAYIGECKP